MARRDRAQSGAQPASRAAAHRWRGPRLRATRALALWVFQPPLVSTLHLIDDGLASFGVRLPCQPRLQIDIENPHADRLAVRFVEIRSPEARWTLQSIRRPVEIVQPLDCGDHLLAPKCLEPFGGHSLDTEVKRTLHLRELGFEPADAHCLPGDPAQ